MLKQKRIVIALFLLAAVLLSPACYVLADETVEQEETEGTYSSEVPYMKGISVELIRFDLNPLNYIMAETNKQCHIKRIEFRYDKQTNINYSDYEFVFQFKLKSQCSDGSITTHPYWYVIDGDSEEGTVSQLDEILIFFDLKEDYFSWSFDYEDLVTQLQDCIVERDFLQQKSYNTVVSSVDCFIRRKSDGLNGLVSRFVFTWYEDFYKQNCSKIEYTLIEPEGNEVLDSGSVTHHKFAGNFDSDGSNLYYTISNKINDLLGFITDIPEALYVIASNITGIALKLLDLFKKVFPFIPGIIFDVFGVLILFSFFIALWKLIKGK